jgi:3-oxoacyl-(acyl-carrier-protein) synthase
MDKANGNTAYTGLEIAIIGMAGSFPGAADIEAFRENLERGVESISFFSPRELIEAGHDPAEVEHPDYVKAISVMADKQYFDAAFFGYLDEEARLMDPQMRVFHQCVWTALEDAGYDPDTYPGQTGLFAGAGSSLNWEAYVVQASVERGIDGFYAGQLRDKDFMPSRIAYKLNLKGPSVFVKTACSTSLVALHMACRALLTGDCRMAIAGGVSIKNEFKTGYMYKEGLVASPDGHCRAFDADSRGAVSGEGAVAVILKKLKTALADGDHVHAVIKGSAVNNDGLRKVGFTAPSMDGQAEAIRLAHKMARVEPRSISYVEAHGTGTVLGDPVEIAALTQVFGTSEEKYCALGSVKSNIGHLDEAGGGAGLIKTVLALKHKQIPPSLHYRAANPELGLEESPFYINTRLRRWENPGYPLRAGVSAFGIGGNNAHVILEEAPVLPSTPLTGGYYLFVLSARTEAALERMTENLRVFLKNHRDISPADAAYTLQIGRRALECRRFWVCKDISEAADMLSAPGAPGACRTGIVPKGARKDEFAWPGEARDSREVLEEAGMQWLQGAAVDWRELYGDSPPRRVPLPTYSFEKTAYPVAVDAFKMMMQRREPVAPGTVEEAEAGHRSMPRPDLDTEYLEPAGETETKLAQIWQEVLGYDRVGAADDFFRLGGHSLKAVALAARVHRDFRVHMPFSEVFKRPFIRAMAEYIDASAGVAYRGLEPVEKRAYYPLSPAQKRIYILYRMDPSTVSYNMPHIVHLEGTYDIAGMDGVCRRLIRRHESLRTSFHMRGRNPVQRVHDTETVNFIFEYDTVEGMSSEPGAEEPYASVVRNFIRPFDLSKAPLFRAGLVKVDEGKYILLVDLHHIISDGVSQGILVAEALQMYADPDGPLPELRLQYKDFACWRQERMEAGELREQEAYWLDRFREAPAPLDIPLDYPRPPSLDPGGRRLYFRVPEAETSYLRDLAGREGATMFMVALALFQFLLSRLSGQEDIVVGTVVAGRGHGDLDDIIGMFVNTLALRNFPTADKTFIQLVREVRDGTLEAFDHQDYPFEDLVEKTVAERDANRNPLFDVMYSFNAYEPGQEPPDNEPAPEPGPEAVQAKFDLVMSGTDTGKHLDMGMEFRTALFKTETIQRFTGYFKEIAAGVVENENMRLGDFNIAGHLAEAGTAGFAKADSEFDF